MGGKNENAYIALSIKALNQLEELKQKISKSSGNSSENDGSIILMQHEYNEAKQKMTEAFMNDDSELAAELKKRS